MRTRLTGVGYGRCVGFDVEVGLDRGLRDLLPFWWRNVDADPEEVWTLDSGQGLLRAVRDMELWVAEHAVGKVFVHAAVIAVGGRALLLPGRSATGKTTLTAALLAAGADYLSDEYAVLDGEGLVHPYPRPLSVRAGVERLSVSAAELGATTAVGAVPVAAVALLTYAAGAEWDPRQLSPSEAVLRLLDNTVSARRDAGAALAACAAAVTDSVALQGARGEVDDAVADLLTRV